MSFVATVRRLQPKTKLVLVASSALILVASIVGIVVATQSGGDRPDPSATQTTISAVPSAEPTATVTAPAVESTITDITVDGLVDKLNAGEASVGERFRVTGELVGSEYWTTGAHGDFFVMLETTEGSDLEVILDEATANGWQDGTTVEMVLKTVEVTIDGETLDGYLEAQSAKTISGGTTASSR